MRTPPFFAFLLAGAACRAPSAPRSEYLFVWAGDSPRQAGDLRAVLDGNVSSPQYGAVVTSIPIPAV